MSFAFQGMKKMVLFWASFIHISIKKITSSTSNTIHQHTSNQHVCTLRTSHKIICCSQWWFLFDCWRNLLFDLSRPIHPEFPHEPPYNLNIHYILPLAISINAKKCQGSISIKYKPLRKLIWLQIKKLFKFFFSFFWKTILVSDVACGAST